MNTYHKIPTAWKRDPETNYKTLIKGAWATPEIEYLLDNDWHWTEKVDGTNIRVMWDGETVTFGGKTDRAELYPRLVEKLEAKFPAERMKEEFGVEGGVCLYGEGYGAKIQKGHKYIGDAVDFILFDVKVGHVWLNYGDVYNIGKRLIGFSDERPHHTVPSLYEASLVEAIEAVRTGRCKKSLWGDFDLEGLVLRPIHEISDRRGNRIITKIKLSDFAL